MGFDTLSDALQAVRLTGAVYFDFDASPPWVVEAPPGASIAASIVPGSEHLISYHVVTEGSCWGGVVDTEPVRLAAGDVIVFPQGDPHVMASAPGMRAAPQLDSYRRPPGRRLPFPLRESSGPSGVHLVCGLLGCDLRPFNPFIATLPRVLVMSDDGAGWSKQLATLAIRESRAPRIGGEAMLARLSELMFIEVVRRHIATLTEQQTGWLAGVRDEQIGRALALLHERPANPWSLEGVAKEVGMSRSAFAARFVHFVGKSPMQYLARWRMQVAAGLLVHGGASVADVAEQVSYESEAAFSRAFKKLVGVAPSEWRRHRMSEPPSTSR